MNAVELLNECRQRGVSARSLSIALDKDPSYLSTMAKKGYEVPASLVRKARRFFRGDEQSAWAFKGDDIHSQRLTDAISHNGIAVAKLAEQLGVTRATVYKWCQGKGSPRDESVATALAEALGVSVDFLYGYGEEVESNANDAISVAVQRRPPAEPRVKIADGLQSDAKMPEGYVNVTLSAKAFEAIENLLKQLDPGFVGRRL